MTSEDRNRGGEEERESLPKSWSEGVTATRKEGMWSRVSDGSQERSQGAAGGGAVTESCGGLSPRARPAWGGRGRAASTKGCRAVATVGDRLPVRQVLEGMPSEGLEDLGELADDGAEVAGDRDAFVRGEGRKVGSGRENNIIDRIQAQR